MGITEILVAIVAILIIFDVWSCWKIFQLIAHTQYYDIEQRKLEGKVDDIWRKVIHFETEFIFMKENQETYKTGCPYK